jgi:hypothetical protein
MITGHIYFVESNKTMHCQHRIVFTLVLYTVAVLAVFVARPATTFNDDGTLKPFGAGQQKTLLGLGVVIVLCAVTSTFAVAMADLRWRKA